MDLKIALLGFAIFLLAMGGMAIGVVFGRRPLRGSCGGIRPGTGEPDPEASCTFCEREPKDCPNRARKKPGSSEPLE